MLEVKNKSGKILSFVLAFMLLLTLVPLSVGATDSADGESANRGKISMVYLGTGESPDISASSFDTSQWETGQTFWVGLRMSGFTNVDNIPFDTTNGRPSHFTNANDSSKTPALAGITFLGAGFDYDPEYVEPVFYAYGEKDETWKDDTTMAALGLSETINTLPGFNGANYTVSQLQYQPAATSNESTYPTGIASAARILTQITTTNVATAIFGHNKPVSDDEPVYMAVMQFELKKRPTEGAKIIAATLNNADTILQTGSNAQRWKAQWNEDRAVTPDTNLKNHFDYTGNLNFFPNTYTVHYNLGEGGTYTGTETDWNDKTISEGQTVGAANILPDSKKLSKTGSIFAGWYLDDNFDASSVKFDENTVADDSLATEGVINVYAKWEPGYKITIDPNDGETEATVLEYPQSQTAFTETDKPAQPTRANYVFKEWNTKQNGTGTSVTQSQLEAYTFNGETTPEYEFYAQWQTDPNDSIADVIVTFDGNGVDVENNPTTDKEPNPKTITINSGDVIAAGNMPDEPVRNGYTFAGWNTEANGTGDEFTGGDVANGGITENMTVYAQWTVTNPDEEVEVTFSATDADAGKGPNPSKITIKSGDSIGEVRMPDAPERNGYVFGGWNTAADGSGTAFTGTTPVGADITVYATWKVSATITFYANKTIPDVAITTVEVAKDEVVPANVIPKDVTNEGYVLVGWNTQANGGGDDLTGFVVKEDTAFYAIWQAVKDTDGDGVPDEPIAPDDNAITVNFNVNCAADAGAVVKPAVRYLKDGHTKLADIPTAMPSASRPKYKLLGWNTTPGGTGTAVDANTVLTGFAVDNVVTLYAQWEADPNSEDFDPENDKIVAVRTHKKIGDTDVLKTYQVIAGQKLGFAFDEPTNPGLTLEGWVTFNGTTGEDAEALPFDPTTDVVLLANATETEGNYYYDVYATWSAESATVTLENTVVTYNGEVQGAHVTKITIGGEDATAFFDENDYVITYTQQEVEGASAINNPINAGTYDISITFLNDNITVDVIESATEDDESVDPVFIINPAPVAFALETGTTQSVKTSASEADRMLKLAAKATLIKNDTSSEEVALTQGTDFSVEYYKLADVSNPEVPEGATWDPSIASTNNIGDYVAKIVVSNANYKVGSLDPAIKYYGESQDPLVNASKMKFTVTPDIELNGFVVVNSKDEDFTTNPKTIYADNTFSDDNTATFDPNDTTKEYYINAGVDEDIKIQFSGTFGDGTTVTITRNAETPETITTTLVDGNPTTGEITLAPANGTNNGISNTITINLSGSEAGPIYIVHVRQLVEARIELAYGNSPVGMIMGNDEKYADEAAKTAAIDAFRETRVFGDVTADRIYNAEAWTSYAEFIDNEDGTKSAYDGDLDPYSVFLFQRRGFMDVGFRAINSLGEEVEATDVTRTMNVIAYKGGIPTYNDTTDMVENVSIVVNQAENYIINDILTYDIRPDVYTMTYKFTDPIVGEITPVKRNYIVISRIGDAIIDANDVVNPNDGNSIVTGYRAMMDANSLYAFRICDALPDANNIVNANDGKTVVISYSKLLPFYNNLYSSLDSQELEQ